MRRILDHAATAVLLVFSLQTSLHSQAIPKQFEVYYDVGIGSIHDSFDTEKKTRTIDAAQGPFTYTAQLTDVERKQIYDAIVQNKVMTLKNDFTDIGNFSVSPATTGKLRLKIDVQMKEIRFNTAYGLKFGYSGGTSSDKDEWTRLTNVRNVIEGILKVKDGNQKLPAHHMYQ